MYPQVYARKTDQDRDDERRDPEVGRTVPEGHGERAEGRRRMSRGEGIVLGLVDDHLVLIDQVGRTTSADGLFDDDLADQVVDAERHDQDDTGVAVRLVDDERYRERDPPDERSRTRIGTEDHQSIEKARLYFWDAVGHLVIQRFQLAKHTSP